ncbi:MAG: pyrroline-5-carboxylate reductase [Cyanobacteria bacterium J06581_3]
MPSSLSKRLGFVGGGVITEAIVSRLLISETVLPEEVFIREVDEERAQGLQAQYSIQLCESYEQLVDKADVLLLAVRPQVFAQDKSAFTLPEGANVEKVISLMTGVPIAILESIFAETPVVRVIPNTPATVGSGITAITPGSKAQQKELVITRTIFETVGQVVFVPEISLDAVVALSASGPAYLSVAIEAFTDAGVSLGLPRPIAYGLAVQTMRGTADLLSTTKMHPAVLRDRIAGPSGPTVAGIKALEKAGFRTALHEAVQASYDQSQYLDALSESDS